MPASKGFLDRTAIAFVGNYLPRQCGIATFTHDLTEAVALQAGREADVFTVAMNDQPEGYDYPPRVRFEVRQNVQSDYRLAADFLNIQQVSTVCLQHEYGIYGGSRGSHILTLLRRIRRPLVTTLHTVLQEPDDDELLVMREILNLSDRVVVMAEKAYEILERNWSPPREKVVIIPHGIPDVPFVDPNFYKDQFGVEGKKVLLTFGLLSPGKGLEYCIDALPNVVKNHPEVVYIVLGATHPGVKRESGEEYRNSLTRRVHELGLDDNVIFVNRFVELEELCEYLGAADIYLTPYLNEAQITSGTLAYALGAGKATVSTPYWHAAEALVDGRGRLVPFKDASAMAEQINHLLDNEVERHAMRKAAYTHFRRSIWSRVAQDYLDLFEDAKAAWVERQHDKTAVSVASKTDKSDDLPEPDLRHLRVMTDSSGILRFCNYATPDRRHGYATEDAARALIVTSQYWDLHRDNSVIPLMHTYLSYLDHAFDEKTGRFRGRMNYDRSFADSPGSEDVQAICLHGLGIAVALCPHESMIGLATRLFLQALPAVEAFASPRAWAFTAIGLHAYLRRFGGDAMARRIRADLGEKLFGRFCGHMSDDWPWFEDVVTYANAAMPHALLMCGKWMNRGDMIDVGKHALNWLFDVQTNDDGVLSVIGTNGWYVRGGQPAPFDQLPLETHGLLDAAVEAYHVTREDRWIEKANMAFHWFLGDNDLRTPLYDFTTGGCRDGLHDDRVNENQGAESLLAWLMSLLTMHELQIELTLGDVPADKTKQRRISKAIRPAGPVVGAKVPRNARSDRND